MRTPKRRKLMSTSQYIYKTLFLQGQNSDITIVALSQEWKLHKVYLCQSPYFSSMFCGSWREAEEGIITVGIEDPNVTANALKIVFGSLYQDEVSIEPAEVVPVLSTATLFQLDGMIQQCAEIMLETINLQTVLLYYEAAEQYGLKKVAEKSFEWLLRNLMIKIQESAPQLRQINTELMTKLISSPELIVMQTEFSIYILLKTWIFVHENPSWDGNMKAFLLEAHKCVHETSNTSSKLLFTKERGKSFLETESGEPYLPAFRALRSQHLVNHHLDVELLDSDQIVPKSWFLPVFKTQWYTMLRVDQGVDRGPKQIAQEEFDSQCLRCARKLISDGQHIWRWTGFNFGLDLVVTYHMRCVRFRRNQRNDSERYIPSIQPCRRHLMYRLTIYSLDKQGHATYTATTNLKTLTLAKNEEVKVLNLDKDCPFPIVVSANFLVTTPLHSPNSSRQHSPVRNAKDS
ncbi:germ cell-less protein-like 1 [Centruroides sculpturatus]|uniref:germ cell-less protein-like 1 n=2 Tax=Centruroides sculpturatus TaxID=218467 RepID=UPI000C6CA322|nr:germ cell-less protein-like 1 [Centruroides sculpturatus]